MTQPARAHRKPPRLVDVELSAIAPDGFATGSAEQREIRVKGARPGERVRARVVRRRGGTWWTLPELWLGGSSHRRAPVCPAFLRCGGCTLQQLDAAEQLRLKQDWLIELLAEHGVVAGQIEAPATGPLLGYRRKARLAGRYLADKGEYLLGFRESLGSRVARLEACPVLAAPFDAAFGELKRVLGSLRIRADVPQVELAAGDNGATLAVRHLVALPPQDVALLEEFQRARGVQVLLQPGGYDSLRRLDGGPERLLDFRLDEFGVCLEFGVADFVQVNAQINERLVGAAVTVLAPAAGERVLDLFCGLGNFTLPVARSGAEVVGAEGSASMVARARRNATVNGVASRCRIVSADLYDSSAPAALDEGAFDKALVDPPRSGCGNALHHLTDSRVQRIVYVSCHPHSFARDAAQLTERGFDLQRLGLFDMFPHTAHVETLAVFERR